GMGYLIFSPFKVWFPRLDAQSRCFGFAGPAQIAVGRAPSGARGRSGRPGGPCYHRLRSFLRGVASQGPPPLPMAVSLAGPASLLSPEYLRNCFFGAARWAAAALLVLAMTASAAEDTVTLNFVNADIDAVVKAAAEITGRNFILDPRIKGTVNIVSARPVPRELVYPTLLSALRLQGIVAVEGNGVTKLVMEVDGKQQGSEVLRGPVTTGGDRLVTQVVTLRYESALQLVNVLRPLISPNNSIAAYPGTNALIITDYADNLRRIDKIIASLDVPPSGEPLIVTLKN